MTTYRKTIKIKSFKAHYPSLITGLTSYKNLDFFTSSNKGNNVKKHNYLHMVIDAFVKARHSYQVKQDDYSPSIEFPLCVEKLRDITRDYNDYLTVLIDDEVIFLVEEGKTGNCGMYKFLPPYDECDISSVVLRSSGNSRAIDFTKYKTSNVEEDAVKKFPHLYDSFEALTVDKEELEHVLDTELQKLITKDNPPYDPQYHIERYREELENINNYPEVPLTTFKIGKTGRLFTSISNLPSELRPSLRLNGKRLIELDLKNSIPFFSICLYESSKDIIDNIQGVLKKGEIFNLNPIIGTKKRHEPDVIDYIEGVSNGSIYSILGELWARDEKNAKTKFLTYTNLPPYRLDDNKEWQLFKERFPTVAYIIEDINRDFKVTKKMASKRKYHNAKDKVCAYAYITQAIEAYFMLELIPEAIQELYPDLPIITLHDAIYVSEHADGVAEMMKDVIHTHMGHRPEIRITPL